MSDDDERIRRLLERFRKETTPLPTGGIQRLFKTGRAAAGMAMATLGARFRAGDSGRDDMDLESVALLVSRLGELKGIAMKAGQIVSYADASLPAEMRSLLSLLQTTSQATPFPAVEETIRSTLGPRADELLADMERAPLATASIGQVHRARLPSGLDVVVKVRHPGIVDAIHADFRAAGTGAVLASMMGGGAAATVRGFIAEAERAFLEECDYLQEAQHQARFVELFNGDDTLVVPEVFGAYSSDAVLTTRWSPGRTFDAFLDSAPSAALRNRAGRALFRFYIGTLYRHGVFHADPHPGNFAFRDDGRVVIYDYGCVRTFDRATVSAFAQLIVAVRSDDRSLVEQALIELGGSAPPDDDVWRITRTLLRDFFSPLLTPGECAIEESGARRDMREILRDKRALAKLSLPGHLLFLFRLRFGLYAVLTRLGAVADWSQLEAQWADDALGSSRL